LENWGDRPEINDQYSLALTMSWTDGLSTPQPPRRQVKAS